MAFDRPLEADRVDDLGLFSSIVHAPILRPLVWILGGNLEKDHTEDEGIMVTNTKQCPSDQTDSTLVDSDDTFTLSPYRNAPDLSGSDVSCTGDEICSIDADSFDEGHSDDHTKSEDTSAAKSKRRRQDLKKTRGMSWSDESGQSLVEYSDELQSSAQVLQGSSSVQKLCRKPIKSAIRKSKKGSGNLSYHPTQCVPSGLSGGSISMPTGGGIMKAGNVALSGGNGYISPQWGWYISTTPPTPEKYHARAEKINEEQLVKQSIFGRQVTSYRPRKPTSVPVFKRVANDVNCTDGWPSVPL